MSEKLASLHKKGGGKRTDSGLCPYDNSNPTKITLGYKPTFLAITRYKDSTHYVFNVYSEDMSSSVQFTSIRNGTSQTVTSVAIPTSSSGYIGSIDNDGFTINSMPASVISTYGVPYFRAAE